VRSVVKLAACCSLACIAAQGGLEHPQMSCTLGESSRCHPARGLCIASGISEQLTRAPGIGDRGRQNCPPLTFYLRERNRSIDKATLQAVRVADNRSFADQKNHLTYFRQRNRSFDLCDWTTICEHISRAYRHDPIRGRPVSFRPDQRPQSQRKLDRSNRRSHPGYAGEQN
jgi:hypothetical protein